MIEMSQVVSIKDMTDPENNPTATWLNPEYGHTQVIWVQWANVDEPHPEAINYYCSCGNRVDYPIWDENELSNLLMEESDLTLTKFFEEYPKKSTNPS